jgi:hypothetical protein
LISHKNQINAFLFSGYVFIVWHFICPRMEVNVMRKIPIMLIVLMIICMGFFSGCLQKPTYNNTNMVNPTHVEIIGRSTRTGFEGFDYVVYVDVTVENQGAEGKATIWASLIQGDNQWTKNQAIYLNQGETGDLTFSFYEVSFWSISGLTYRVWIE